MLSSDRNIEHISQLIIELKHFTELRIESFQTDFVGKMTRLLAAFVVGAVLFMLLSIVAVFVSIMAATALSPYVGGEAAGYAVVVAFYVLLAVMFYKKRHTWVEAPIANFLGHLFLDGSDSQKDKGAEE